MNNVCSQQNNNSLEMTGKCQKERKSKQIRMTVTGVPCTKQGFIQANTLLFTLLTNKTVPKR